MKSSVNTELFEDEELVIPDIYLVIVIEALSSWHSFKAKYSLSILLKSARVKKTTKVDTV